MRKLTGTSPFHPERVGPSCMARFVFFFGGGGGVCVVLVLSVNQSAVSLGWFGAMVMYI